MELRDLQRKVDEIYQERGWRELDPYIRVGFLMEEVGELARAVRALEIGRDRPDESRTETEWKQELLEELGDVLGNVVLLAGKYGLSLEEIVQVHTQKLAKRYGKK
ncbi:MazG nucleotide pyrophosphohydrolase domain-containing protein [Risungbinella massiliensis]|uniref:MazG nucleotide pyrophosphohydrolase domain-containing protein n=1 Tax=Risungbinella massiliensis TaxID=1329796 RepID=UPI0005CC1636|nr:MazG-like family protein [Risungbinella massiliensis]